VCGSAEGRHNDSNVGTKEVAIVVLPGSGALGHYSSLVARGVVRLKATTTADLDRIPHYDVPDDMSPLDVLLAERAEDER
jgi:hypothetical protein